MVLVCLKASMLCLQAGIQPKIAGPIWVKSKDHWSNLIHRDECSSYEKIYCFSTFNDYPLCLDKAIPVDHQDLLTSCWSSHVGVPQTIQVIADPLVN